MMANAIRALSMDAVQKAKSGHPGMPMGMADIATALWSRHLRFNPTNPKWTGRDRFILSNGHGSMLQYALLHLTGYVHGGCSPVGMKKQYPTVFHETAELFDTICVSAGKIGAQVEVAPADLIALLGAQTADITAE